MINNTASDVRTIGEHNLTVEMNDIIDATQAGLSLKGFAYAGAGKSTLLRSIEKYHSKKYGLYICYNKSLEREARKLFKGHKVDIATGHSLALNSFNTETIQSYLNKIKLKLTRDVVLEHSKANVNDEEFSLLDINKNFRVIKDTVERYISSASIDITEIHLSDSSYDLVNKLIKSRKIKASKKSELYQYIVNQAKKLCRAMLDPNCNCPCTHDTYMKAWQLSNPKFEYDYIMFDEAQDANPVLLSVILKQKSQQIFVGDKFQSIYQFRGGVNAMDIIPHEALPLSCSFRYGPELAELATKVLKHMDDSVCITGVGYNTEVIRGSKYNGTDKLLYLSHTNINLLEVLCTCFQAGVPAVFTTNKALFTLEKVKSMISLSETGTATLPAHKRYKSIEALSLGEKDLETQAIFGWLNETPEKVNALAEALAWTQTIPHNDAMIFLSTAHGSKGLEFDNVMLGDDFVKIEASFGNGKPIDESELNLFYVAITRAKKSLVLPDGLFNALEENLTFTINKTVVPKCATDNVLPEGFTLTRGNKVKSTVQTKTLNDVRSEQKEKAQAREDKKTLRQAKAIIENQKKTVDTPKPPSRKQTSKKEVVKPTEQNSVKTKKSDTLKPSASPSNLSTIKVEVGRDKESNAPLFWEPTNTDLFLNPNIAVVGTMGTGKTQTVKSVLTQLKQQAHLNTDQESFGVLIFDYKSDYIDDEFVQCTGANILEPCHLPINPLALHSKSDRLAPVKTAKVFVSTLSKVFNLGIKQDGMLKNCIMAAYERKGIDKADISSLSKPAPTLHDVIAIFNSQDKVPQDKLNEALADLWDFEMFEKNSRKCHSLYDTLDGNVTVVKLGGLDSNLQNLIVAVLLDQFYTQMHLAPKPKPHGSHRAIKKMILVDEADNFMSQDFPSLRKILKEGREFGVGVALSTQGLDHFETNENNYRNYMTSWLVHRLEGPRSAHVEPLFNTKTKKELEDRITEVRSLEKHHSLYVNGKKEILFQESTAFWCLDK